MRINRVVHCFDSNGDPRSGAVAAACARLLLRVPIHQSVLLFGTEAIGWAVAVAEAVMAASNPHNRESGPPENTDQLRSGERQQHSAHVGTLTR